MQFIIQKQNLYFNAKRVLVEEMFNIEHKSNIFCVVPLYNLFCNSELLIPKNIRKSQEEINDDVSGNVAIKFF